MSEDVETLVKGLPAKLKAAAGANQPEIDTGVTISMEEGTAKDVAALRGMFVALARTFRPGHFGHDPGVYFDKLLSDRADLWAKLDEPDGPGKDGTMAGVLEGGDVYADAKGIVAAVAMAAIGEESSLDVAAWRKDWDAAG